MSGLARDRKAQSEPIGVMLLLGLVILAIGSLGVHGAQSIDDTTARASIGIAEEELVKFAGQSEDVAIGDASVRTVSLALGTAGNRGTTIVREDAGRIRIQIGDAEVVESTLGVVEYENQGVSIGYQAGGVWRRTASGSSQTLHPPSFSNQNITEPTLTIPLIIIQGVAGLNDNAVIRRTAIEQPYPSVLVPIEETVIVTIESRYYEAWAAYVNESLGIPNEQITMSQPNERITFRYGAGKQVYLQLTVRRLVVSPLL